MTLANANAMANKTYSTGITYNSHLRLSTYFNITGHWMKSTSPIKHLCRKMAPQQAPLRAYFDTQQNRLTCDNQHKRHSAFIYCYAECSYAECHYPKCRCAKKIAKLSCHRCLIFNSVLNIV
jgi:hypothetical protein